MKRILTAIVFSLVALSAAAQTQREQIVIIETPAELNEDCSIKREGEPISGAVIHISDGNIYESDTVGKLSFYVANEARYSASKVSKENYELISTDIITPGRSYTKSPSYVLMQKSSKLIEAELAEEKRQNTNIKAELKKRDGQIEELKRQNLISEKEAEAERIELYNNYANAMNNIRESAREKVRLDYARMSIFDRQFEFFLRTNKLKSADSLLATKGDIERRKMEIANLRTDKLTNLSLIDSLVQSLGGDMYKKHEISSRSLKNKEAALWLEERAKLDPENVEWQMDAAEYICTYIGDYNKSLGYYNNALTISEKTLGIEKPTTATIYNGIGMCYSYLGGYEIALEYYNKALSIREKRLGSEHPLTAISYGNIGSYYIDLNNYDIALEYYFKTLAIQEKVLGTGHPDTATTYNNIGWCYYNLGYIYNALEYFCKSMVVREVALGVEHHLTATSYSQIGLCCSKLGNYDEALVYHRKAMKILENTFGSEHPNTAVIYNNVGTCYNDLDDYDKALEYYYKALKIYETVLGTEHPDTAVTYSNIGLCYGDLGDCDKALEYHNKALKIYEKSFGSEHPYTKITTETITSLKTQN